MATILSWGRRVKKAVHSHEDVGYIDFWCFYSSEITSWHWCISMIIPFHFLQYGSPLLSSQVILCPASGWDIKSQGPLVLTHLPLDKMAAISQTTFSNAFSWMKSFVFWFKFRRSLFLRVQLTISQHWFRKWLGADLDQCLPTSPTHICGTRVRWVKAAWCWCKPFYHGSTAFNCHSNRIGIIALVRKLPLRRIHWPLGDLVVIIKVQFVNACYRLKFMRTASWNALKWMPQYTFDDELTLVQVMAWCSQTTSHYLNQCWPRFTSPYGVTRPPMSVNNDCFLLPAISPHCYHLK